MKRNPLTTDLSAIVFAVLVHAAEGARKIVFTRVLYLMLLLTAPGLQLHAQAPAPAPTDADRLRSVFPIPYAPPSAEDIKGRLDQILAYLEQATPARLVNRSTGEAITDHSQPNAEAMLVRGDFPIVSYEMGVTYSAMLLAAEVTGDARYRNYVDERLKFITRVAPLFRIPAGGKPPERGSGGAVFRSVNAPRSLDDSGSMCAAMIKAQRAGVGGEVRPLIDNYIKWITTEQFRLADGTLARNRPMANALWLDDLYMSVPALAQMGHLTGDRKYYDDATRQILQFAGRMFVPAKGLFMHGWIQAMHEHPAYLWARANGWALMAMTELLDVLPDDHPNRGKVFELYRAHVRGLAACQSGQGLWHQVLDRNDSYMETSASAIFVYCTARGINRGWLDSLACGPMAVLGWNAVAQKINAKGQVEGTCIGTGMAFDPMFYYHRPTSVAAAHGYGTVLLAGVEMIKLRRGAGREAHVNDGAIQIQRQPPNP